MSLDLTDQRLFDRLALQTQIVDGKTHYVALKRSVFPFHTTIWIIRPIMAQLNQI